MYKFYFINIYIISLKISSDVIKIYWDSVLCLGWFDGIIYVCYIVEFYCTVFFFEWQIYVYR